MKEDNQVFSKNKTRRSTKPPASLVARQEAEDAKKEYRDLLIDLYKENQKFLNNAIFGVSTLAIPYLLKSIPEVQGGIWAKGIQILAFMCFIAVIFLQIWSLKCARDGCDNSLSTKEAEKTKGSGLFMKAKNIDIWRERTFAAALALIFLSLIPTLTMETKAMANKNRETGWLNQAIDKSFTPPTSMVPQNGTTTPAGGPTAKQTQTETKPNSSQQSKK